MRSLLATEHERQTNCGVPWYGDPVGLLEPSGFILYLFAVIWICIGLRVVSDEYFAVCIEGIAHRWKIPHSVAGATLMAIGASTPELVASFIGVFVAAESATGAGTVIGSIIFNHLTILGCCILVSPGQFMKMTFIEFSRDMFFYALAIALFVWFFIDGSVSMTESWSLLGCYGAFVIACAFWHKVEPVLFRLVGDERGFVNHTEPHQPVVDATPAPRKSAEVALKQLSMQDPLRKPLRHIHKPFFTTYVRTIPSYWSSNHGASLIMSANSSMRDMPGGEIFPGQLIQTEQGIYAINPGQFPAPVPAAGNVFPAASFAPPPAHLFPQGGPFQPAMHPMYPQAEANAGVTVSGSSFGGEGVYPQQMMPNQVVYNVPAHHQQPVHMPMPPPLPPHLLRHGMRLGSWAHASAHQRGYSEQLTPFELSSTIITTDGAMFSRQKAVSSANSTNGDVNSAHSVDGIEKVETAVRAVIVKDVSEPATNGVHEDGKKTAASTSKAKGDAHDSEQGKDKEHHEEDDRVWRNPWQELLHVYREEGLIRQLYFFCEFFWVVVVWVTGGWLRQHQWWLTLFVVMLGWIVLQCVYLTYWLEKCACTIGITPGAMGTILGAAGTSIPNLLCSIYVARKGHGVMACTEVWGSNIWLVFVCLGLPWGIYSTITGKAVHVQNSNSLSIWMCCVFGVYIIQSVATNWYYNKYHGWIYNIAYIAFIIFVFVNESLHFAD